MIGLVLGLVIYILLNIAKDILIKRFKENYGSDINRGAEREAHTPDTPLGPLATSTRIPTITTVKTMPGQAISDMGRDIQLQVVKHPELQDLEAAMPRTHR